MNRNVVFAILGAALAGVLAFFLLQRSSPPLPAVPTQPSEAPQTPRTNPVAAPPSPAAPSDSIDPAQVKPVASGAPLDLATVALEAKMIASAKDLLAQGKPRDALKQIDEYEHVPDRAALVPEATFVKIEALARVGGRRTDALALAMSTRTDPAMAPYQARIDALLYDAGLASPTSDSP